jgi:hypothetical protein
MSTAALRFLTVGLESVTCYKCGCLFAVEASVRQRWQREGISFYCPNGHVQSYAETDVQRLQKQLDAEKKTSARLLQEKTFAQNNAAAERAAREKTERRLTATKSAKTRMANRIKHGVCPCCHRTVSQLARHMATQHPQFNKAADAV